MGVSYRRMPWTTDELRSFVSQTLAPGQGTWVMDVVGAVAEFTVAPGEAIKVTQKADDFVAHTTSGAMRIRIDDDVRALTFDAPGTGGAPRIVLATKRLTQRMPGDAVVSDLGDDPGCLMPEQNGKLFDLGLGRREARFCVRVDPGQAHSALQNALGASFSNALPQIVGPLMDESPTRVVETSIGRIEVSGAIPLPTASSPAGPHTHLLPDQLALQRALPVDMDLPRTYLPAAIFYPKNLAEC